MTPTKINQTIAEACGWRQLSSHFGGSEGVWQDSDGVSHAKIPNYNGDLNACAEMVSALDRLQKSRYHSELHRIVGIENAKDGTERYATEATAPQRAEAFCKTLGLWEESK